MAEAENNDKGKEDPVSEEDDMDYEGFGEGMTKKQKEEVFGKIDNLQTQIDEIEPEFLKKQNFSNPLKRIYYNYILKENLNSIESVSKFLKKFSNTQSFSRLNNFLYFHFCESMFFENNKCAGRNNAIYYSSFFKIVR